MPRCACANDVEGHSRMNTPDLSDTGKNVKRSRRQVKRCKVCGLDKPLDAFPNDAARKDGKYPYCKLCNGHKKRESNARVRNKDPEAYIEKWRGYRKTYQERHPERHRHQTRCQSLKRDFGISMDQYVELSESQGGVCAICGTEPVKKALAVDHNHITGEIRGLLCGSCNMALGQLEVEDRLHRAVDYIMRFQ